MIVYEDLQQGSSEWLQARAGLITASTIGQLISTKTLKPAQNETSRGLVLSLVDERMSGEPEESIQTRDMLRGTLSEPYARELYEKHHAPVREVGGIIRSFDTFSLWLFTGWAS